jgi:hypothetical protein
MTRPTLLASPRRLLALTLLILGALVALLALVLPPGGALLFLDRGALAARAGELAPALGDYHRALTDLQAQGAQAGNDGKEILATLATLSAPIKNLDAAQILDLRAAHHRGLPILLERLSTLAGAGSAQEILALRRASCSLETGLEQAYSLVASARLSQLFAGLLLMLASLLAKRLGRVPGEPEPGACAGA